MSRTLKIVLYLVCIIGIAIFGSLSCRAYRTASKTAEHSAQRLDHVASTETPAAATTPPATGTNVTDTNAVAATDTNNVPDTNAVAGITNAASTNAVAAATNAAKQAASDPDLTPSAAGASARSYTKMVTYGLVLVLLVIALAVLIGYDVAQFMGHQAQEALFSNEGQPVDPEYEQAEQMWNNGQYLEAVRAMRSYLEKNPREQYVALRIAEIYEENLNNPLAAALEYEEVLKKKLPTERWGWAAIHLANIYSGKLNQPDKAIALLRRIDSEYGHTVAAKKARERLVQIDPDFVPANVASIAAAAQTQEATEDSGSSTPPSNLPPGFRPKG